MKILDVYLTLVSCYTQQNCTVRVVVLWSEPTSLWKGDPVQIVDHYEVFFSFAPGGDWTQIGTGTTELFLQGEIRHPGVLSVLHSESPQLFFKVKAVWQNGYEEESEVFTFEFPPSLVRTRGGEHPVQTMNQLRTEISKVYETILSLNTEIYYGSFGEPVVVLKRKWAGETCPVCFNPTTRRSEDPYCRTCYGTGIVGGYRAIPARASFQMVYSYRVEPAETGYEQVVRTVSVILPPFPPLHSSDFIIRGDGVAYRVSTIERSRPAGVVIHQKADVVRVDPNDPIFIYPYEEFLAQAHSS